MPFSDYWTKKTLSMQPTRSRRQGIVELYAEQKHLEIKSQISDIKDAMYYMVLWMRLITLVPQFFQKFRRRNSKVEGYEAYGAVGSTWSFGLSFKTNGMQKNCNMRCFNSSLTDKNNGISKKSQQIVVHWHLLKHRHTMIKNSPKRKAFLKLWLQQMLHHIV